MGHLYSDVHATIAALSSPPGKGAISIIRLSGEHCLKIIKEVFLPIQKNTNISKTCISLGVIDRVMLFIRKKPKTYTGEDMAEIHCHGNPIIVGRIMNIVINKGARIAYPGEFTFRAFLNNKMDLIQAEAVNDLITSNTYLSTELAMNQLKGRLSDKIDNIGTVLKEILIKLEVEIDHSDDDILGININKIKSTINRIIKQITDLIESYEVGKQFQKSINITIIGKTNVGKSSLFNMLIKRDKAIISPFAGTTRDAVEEYIEIEDCPLKIIDTAGIKKQVGLIEKQALRRTLQAIEEANIILLMFDNSKILDKNDAILIREIEKYKVKKVIILNKIDLKAKINLNKLKKMVGKEHIFRISVSHETGIKNIEQEISKFINKYNIKNNLVINNIRHKNVLEQVQKFLQQVVTSIQNKFYCDIIASDLKKAVDELSKLTGEYTTENMLNDIFSRFCIGK